MAKLEENPFFLPVDYTVSQGRNNVENKYTRKKLRERKEFVVLRYEPHATVLDVGCAEGEFLRELQRNGFNNNNLFGVEPSLDANGLTDFSIFSKNPTNKQFDIITCFHVLEHIVDTQSFMFELVKMMHDDSALILEVPNGTGHPLVEYEKNSEHVYLFTAESLLTVLSDANLEVLELYTKKFESPGYRDNLRVVAKKKHAAAGFTLPDGPISVFGLGGDFEKYVEPLKLKIEKYFDRNIKKISDGVETINYSSAHRTEKILIASLHYEDEIFDFLIAEGHPRDNILLLSHILMSVAI